MSIYIVTHKKTQLPKLDHYIPIQVGAALHEDLGYLRDDYGDNISKKNPSYCELTALYEIWKNEKKNDIIGMVHYRRFFFQRKISNNIKNIVSFEECKQVLERCDIILPEKRYFKTTIRKQYADKHIISDLEKCQDIIAKKYPEYIEAFNKVLERRYLHPYNMFVMRRDLFDAYMEWLFEILFELEKQLDTSNYDDYNKRIYGFLAERLFNVWIQKNDLKIKLYSVHNMEDSTIKRIIILLKNYIKRVIDISLEKISIL